MPPLIAPVAAGALSMLGALALAKLVVSEWRRINAELHPDAAAAAPGRARLHRDADTGVFRPEPAKGQR